MKYADKRFVVLMVRQGFKETLDSVYEGNIRYIVKYSNLKLYHDNNPVVLDEFDSEEKREKWFETVGIFLVKNFGGQIIYDEEYIDNNY